MPFEICIYAKDVDNRLLTDGYLEINYIIEIKGACAQKTTLKMEIEKNRTTGQCYFATNVAPKGEEPVFENDFCNVVLVGKAHTMVKEIEKLDDLEKYPIFITESNLRLKTGKRQDGSYWTYNEIVVFDFEEVEKEEKPKAKSKSYRRR